MMGVSAKFTGEARGEVVWWDARLLGCRARMHRCAPVYVASRRRQKME